MDLNGKKFGRLIPIEKIRDKYKIKWKCICECGNEVTVYQTSLLSLNTQSCGCLQQEVRFSHFTHSHSTNGKRTKEYRTWQGMKKRCYNSNYEFYHRYGGRGIKVCNEWLNDFKAFFDHVGEAPSEEHSIDRIDNDGDYRPGNVKWSLPIEQANNRS